MPKSTIKVIDTPFHQVLDVLKSDSLRRVEEAIAAAIRQPILLEYASVYVSPVQAAMSVSGLSPAQMQTFLDDQQDRLIAFGIRFCRDQMPHQDEQEYPEGEEPEAEEDPKSVSLGMATGFGVLYAIYLNFLANRTPAELLDYLKNRRIGNAARFARELRRLFDEAEPTRGT